MDDDDGGDRLMGLKVSALLHEQIKQEAARDGVTLRVIVLRALKAAGFTVNDEDLADRRPVRSGRRKAQ
ncbi:hypothetical protein LJR225_005166 [Phenylobacterium sp. LjRoot225]|uniref:hypothetical protein n=1 Tax=Phenylobacterium sp. LjRoot225 TaxID=3342285 RepID=UPI003ECE84BB